MSLSIEPRPDGAPAIPVCSKPASGWALALHCALANGSTAFLLAPLVAAFVALLLSYALGHASHEILAFFNPLQNPIFIMFLLVTAPPVSLFAVNAWATALATKQVLDARFARYPRQVNLVVFLCIVAAFADVHYGRGLDTPILAPLYILGLPIQATIYGIALLKTTGNRRLGSSYYASLLVSLAIVAVWTIATRPRGGHVEPIFIAALALQVTLGVTLVQLARRYRNAPFPSPWHPSRFFFVILPSVFGAVLGIVGLIAIVAVMQLTQ